MTRSEFIANITTWDDLLEFCGNYDIDSCSDVVSDSEKDDAINDALPGYVRSNDWETVHSALDDIPRGFQYYLKNGDFEYEPLDNNDFERYKAEVLDEADMWGIWEDEEEEDFFEEEEEIEEPEPFTIGELYTVCSGVLQSIGKEKETHEKERDTNFDSFVMHFVSSEMKGN